MHYVTLYKMCFKKKKKLYPLLYISNHLSQFKTFRKLKNENTNKKKLKINILDYLKLHLLSKNK
jgi:hypothetical protein